MLHTMQYIDSLFWNNWFIFLDVGHTRGGIYIPNWYSNIEFRQKVYTILGDYHEFNLEIEFVLAYIKLEITLIHFQIVIHKVASLYYCEIYTMFYMVTILNVRIQFFILSYKVYSMLMTGIIIIFNWEFIAGIQVYWIRIGIYCWNSSSLNMHK